MVRLGLVGGSAGYHAQSFSGLINGLASGQALPEDWADYPQCVEGARISVVWDEDKAAAEKLARVFGIENAVDTLEEVPHFCDGVIVADDGTLNHCRHAPFFLERGIPTFIDKPLGPDAGTARRLIDLATKCNTPLMSGSALRYAAEIEELRSNPDSPGKFRLTTAVGPNDLFYYGIHALELAHSVLGAGIVSVQNIGENEHDLVKVKYHDGRILMLFVSRSIGAGFEISLYGPEGRHHHKITDATAFYANQLRMIMRMVREKKAPVPIEDALEIIRVLEAGKRSLKQGGTVVML